MMANRFMSMQYEFDEILSTAYLGLVKAAASFDENKGYTFATYACRVIQNEILYYDRINKKHKNIVTSLDAPIDPEQKYTLLDTVSDGRNPYDMVEKMESFQKNIKYLGDTEIRILMIKIQNPDANQRDIGNVIGKSQVYVSKKMKSLREKMYS